MGIGDVKKYLCSRLAEGAHVRGWAARDSEPNVRTEPQGASFDIGLACRDASASGQCDCRGLFRSAQLLAGAAAGVLKARGFGLTDIPDNVRGPHAAAVDARRAPAIQRARQVWTLPLRELDLSENALSMVGTAR